MLQTDYQRDYDIYNFNTYKNNFNINMFNLASYQLNLLTDIPKDVNKISEITDKLSNLIIISGNCYFYINGNDFKEVSNSNVIFNKNNNTFKLKSIVSSKLQSKEGKNYFISNKTVRIFDRSKTQLKTIDDMLIKKEPVVITTKENNYTYTLSLNFNSIVNLNNLQLKLNEQTVSYPNISEIYYINNNREKVNIRILNNNKYSFNLDTNKNISNLYEIDIDSIETDNINIVLEDIGLDLIIDNLECFYTEYAKEGSIVLQALSSEYPVLKVGLEGTDDSNNIKFSVSHDAKSWLPIELSNTYNIEQTNKVISYNTISNNTVRVEYDVKNIYIKIDIKASQQIIENYEKVNREIYNSSSFDTKLYDYNEYSLYETNDAINFGQTTENNGLNFKDLFNKGEYVIINNKYYIKGFKESDISKDINSTYYNSSISLKNNYKRISGTTIKFNDIDISTKEIFKFNIRKLTKNLNDQDNTKYVLPLKEDSFQSIYYLKHNNKEIEIDLTAGFINSTLDVLYCLEGEGKVYLLDHNKNLIKELPTFKEVIDNVEYSLVSLLDSGLFETIQNISKTYPLSYLKDYEVGLLNNKIEAYNKTLELELYALELKKLYNTDYISDINDNYSKIISNEDYNTSVVEKVELIPKNIKQFKVLKSNIIKGSVVIEEIK